MSPRRRQASSAMLYTLITFVGLFIAATTVAVIYYVKAEDYRTGQVDLQNQINDLASSRERQAPLGAIVGTKPAPKSWLGTMVDYLDEMVTLVVGGVPEPINARVRKILEPDPNMIGLVPIIEGLQAALKNTINARAATQQQLDDLEQRFEDADEANFEKEQTLLAEKDKLQQMVNTIKQDYEELEALLKQSTEQQIQTLTEQLEQEKVNSKELNDTLLKTQAELKMAEGVMRRAQQDVMKIKPPPDREVLAYKLDGKITLTDDRAKVVYLDIGSNDHVYRGLTFSVYDRGTPIPKDGRGKAEIEVFDVEETFSAARITRSEITKPILSGDTIANLIWDSGKTNVFVVAGDFDLDNEGDIDYDAVDRIKALIEKWGGRVADTVSIDTDFLVLGRAPQVLIRPTYEETEMDPTAMERYEASSKRLADYKELQRQAETLWIPIFKYERFLYFIGYKEQKSQAGAF
ncbi:MAG: BRCT domain-containing protein [Planctomycetota bacterium]